ncbi:MAG: 1,4-alpha-glucan branching protein GlgB, partial [Clostridia bacterium]|nr:1,4-alpha-glucan branching protein GlgB [Clostridia bacterium]
MEGFDLAKYLFHQGTNFRSYEYLGVSLKRDKEKYIYSFRTWAPNAISVGLVGDFLSWSQPMPFKKITEKGIFECIFVSDSSLEGRLYKFLIESKEKKVYKGDPYARYSKGGCDGASIIHCEENFVFKDSAWQTANKKSICDSHGNYLPKPINIYELHLGSFLRHEDGSFYTYSALSEILPSYVKGMGYTHVELLPLSEYPFDGSWGYQVGAFYAPTARFGAPEDLKKLVNSLHNAGIGVILDWVGAHFPKDEWGLFEFDGEPLYEYQGIDRQESSSWGTRFFDLGREEVQSFLISNALYYLREFHFDGLRVDAVASMIYLDFDRNAGEWIANEEGTNENKEATAFLKKLNTAVFAEFPEALMIAEESTSFGGITKPTHEGGLGFNLKWNMGFANDFYDYISTDPYLRKYKHEALTFPLMYAHGENYCLPISHDEVVHGKRSFIDKMYGSYEEKFQNARLSLLLLMTYPGKKLLFMGTEYAQFREWSFEESLEWFMLDYPVHDAFRSYVRALNHFYLSSAELYELDFSLSGFSWVSCDVAEKSSVLYKRYSIKGDALYVALNFSGAEQTLFCELVKGKKL